MRVDVTQAASHPQRPHDVVSGAARSGALEQRRGAVRGRSGDGPPPFMIWLMMFWLMLDIMRPEILLALKIPTVMLVVFPLLLLRSKERPWSRQLTGLVLFVAAGCAMMPFAHNYYAIYMNARLMYGMFLTALAATWLLAWRRPFERVVWFWVGLMCLQAVWATVHEGHGYGSFLGDENDLALAVDMAFPFAVVGVQTYRGRKRWLCGFVTLVLLVGIVASWSRGGFLGLVAGTVYSVLAVRRHRVRNVAALCALGLVFYLAVPRSYVTEMETIEDTNEGTAETRFFLWITASRIFADYPILGAGPNNATYLLGQYQPGPMFGMFNAPVFRERDWGMTALHSIYFQLLADRGTVGMGIFLWMLISFYLTVRRVERDVPRTRGAPVGLVQDAHVFGLGLESAMAAFLVAGGFLSMLYYPYFWFFTALAVAYERAFRRELARIGSRETPRPDPETPRPAEPTSALAALLRAPRPEGAGPIR